MHMYTVVPEVLHKVFGIQHGDVGGGSGRYNDDRHSRLCWETTHTYGWD